MLGTQFKGTVQGNVVIFFAHIWTPFATLTFLPCVHVQALLQLLMNNMTHTAAEGRQQLLPLPGFALSDPALSNLKGGQHLDADQFGSLK